MNFVSSITLQFKDAFSAGFANAGQSFAGMKSALGELNQNQSMNRLAADLAMATSLTDPFRQKLSAMMDEPSRLAGTFESSMKNIQAITGLTGEEIGGLGKELRKIGSGTAAGPQAVAEAYNDVAGGITKLAAQMPVLNNAIALAEAGQADLGVATNGLVKIMNSYNFTTGEAAEVSGKAAWASDVMTQAVGMGVGSMNEFVTAMAPISGVAASVGIGFDEIGSTMAFMTATTDTAATAGTKLSAFMTALQKPSSDLSDALKSIGITSGSAMLAQYGLAESANLISKAFGGDQDAMTQAMGRQEAMKAVLSLTADTYSDFASQFGSTMEKITETSQAVQVESYESKIGRLNAATDALKIGIGEDINHIKGFFVDMGAGFLNNVAAPIMSSTVGEVFQGIAAGVGMAAKGVLDLGSGALNTASQLVVMTATLENAGGFAKLFGSSLSMLTAPLGKVKSAVAGMIAPLASKISMTLAATAAESGYAAAMWAAAGATWAATWPVLAIIAGVALLAVGAVALVKNWGAVSAFFVNLWNKVTGAFTAAFNWIKNLVSGVPNIVLVAVAAFMPIIGIPLLIIKNWTAIKGFFSSLWDGIVQGVNTAWTWVKAFFGSLANSVAEFFAPIIGQVTAFFTSLWGSITSIVTGAANWLSGVWVSAVTGFTTIWNTITVFFASLWGGITLIVASAANWLSGVWVSAVTGFTTIWNTITVFFASLWGGITLIVATAANWLSGIWGDVTAPFAAAWTWVADLFTSIWDGIKGVVMGFVEWISPVVDMILAPFRAIGNVIGGIIDTVGGWFGKAADAGNSAVAQMANTAAAQPVQRTASAVTTARVTAPPPAVTPPPPVAASAITAPTLAAATSGMAAPAMPEPVTVIDAGTALTGPAISAQTPIGGETAAPKNAALAAEHLAAAERKGITGSEISYSASGAFENAGTRADKAQFNSQAIDAALQNALFGTSVTPGVDLTELNRQAVSNPFMDSLSGMTATPGVDMAELNRQAASNPFLDSLSGMTATPGVDMTELNRQAASNPFLDSLSGMTATPGVDMAELNKQAASNPFMDSLSGMTAMPGADMGEFDGEASVDFSEAMSAQRAAFEMPWAQPEAAAPEKAAPRIFNISTLNLNADDCFKLFEILRQIEQAVEQPEVAAV